MMWSVQTTKQSHAMAGVLVCISVLASGDPGRGLLPEQAASRVRQPDLGITGEVLFGPTCPG